MKRFISLLALILAMIGYVSAVPVCHVFPKRSKVMVKKTAVVGTRVKKLPAKGITVYYNRRPFVYINGVYYKKLGPSKYEVVRPEVGMIVPLLPDYNVEKVYIKGETLLLFDKTLYRQIPTSKGVQYKVTGFIN